VDEDRILAALSEKPLKEYAILVRVNPSGSVDELRELLLRMRDASKVKFDPNPCPRFFQKWGEINACMRRDSSTSHLTSSSMILITTAPPISRKVHVTSNKRLDLTIYKLFVFVFHCCKARGNHGAY
jgi:hypothetical protein